MGGRDKGLLNWRGRPLIAWLHDLTRPLSDDLIISCNRNQEHYAPYADQLVADQEQDFQGPWPAFAPAWPRPVMSRCWYCLATHRWSIMP